MGLRTKALFLAASCFSMTLLGGQPANAVAICPITSVLPPPENVAVLVAPNTSVSCSFFVVRTGFLITTLTMQSINTATADVYIDGVPCLSVTGISGAAANACPVFSFGAHTLGLSMSTSALAAQATVTNIPLP